MSACQRPEELHGRVMARLDELMLVVSARLPGFTRPAVGYFTKRAAAGLAYYHAHRIELHRELLRENAEDMIHDTIAHELAHLVTFALASRRMIPGTGRGHGCHWQGVMRTWFGIVPKRTHSYDMTNAGVKRQRRWVYGCAYDHTLTMTTTRHNKAQRTARARADGTCGYLCARCHTPITFRGVSA